MLLTLSPPQKNESQSASSQNKRAAAFPREGSRQGGGGKDGRHTHTNQTAFQGGTERHGKHTTALGVNTHSRHSSYFLFFFFFFFLFFFLCNSFGLQQFWSEITHSCWRSYVSFTPGSAHSEEMSSATSGVKTVSSVHSRTL